MEEGNDVIQERRRIVNKVCCRSQQRTMHTTSLLYSSLCSYDGFCICSSKSVMYCGHRSLVSILSTIAVWLLFLYSRRKYRLQRSKTALCAFAYRWIKSACVKNVEIMCCFVVSVKELCKFMRISFLPSILWFSAPWRVAILVHSFA